MALDHTKIVVAVKSAAPRCKASAERNPQGAAPEGAQAPHFGSALGDTWHCSDLARAKKACGKPGGVKAAFLLFPSPS